MNEVHARIVQRMGYDPDTSPYDEGKERQFQQEEAFELRWLIGLSMLRASWPRYSYPGTQPTYHPELGMIQPGEHAVDPRYERLADQMAAEGFWTRVDTKESHAG